MSFNNFKYVMFAAPLLLAACGEGYEMVRTTEIFPYGNQRTAGSGVAYVRAKLLPEKELKLETAAPVAQTTPPAPEAVVTPAPAPVTETEKALEKLEEDVEKLFSDKQKK